MLKHQKFYSITALFLTLGILFSACGNLQKPAKSNETRTAPAILMTTETPVIYETVGLFPPDSSGIDANLCITMRQYHWSGYGISTKSIQDKGYVLKLSQLLENALQTGEILPALSDGEQWVTENSGQLPAKPGTLWIDTQNGFFRLTDDYTSLCRVETHLGEGIALEMSDELRTLLLNLWSYYPYHYDSGTYQDGKLFISHRFPASSIVDIIVKDMHISHKEGKKSTITVEVYSPTQQEITVLLDCRQSDDNLGLGDQKTVSLNANESKTLTLSFIGWTSVGYEVVLTADNTRIGLWIMP
jgi:hypothetical protein